MLPLRKFASDVDAITNEAVGFGANDDLTGCNQGRLIVKRLSLYGLLALAVAVAPACGKKSDKKSKAQKKVAKQNNNKKNPTTNTPDEKPPKGVGVDMKTKTVTIGALNDITGPAKVIGKPFADGKRLVVAQVNAGGSGLLPDGWKLKLIEADHQYNGEKSATLYKEMRNKVLFLSTSFGTHTTVALHDALKRDNMVAFPASLSSQMAKNELTPPLGPAYNIEAMRAMDWAVKKAGGADKVKAGIVYQKDDYGLDALDGWKKAAEKLGVKIVSEQPINPTQQDQTAPVAALKKAGANFILLATLPSSTGKIIGTAAAKFRWLTPTWIGNTPAWVDLIYKAPQAGMVFKNFYIVTGLTYWGEKVPGMDKFEEMFKKHGGDFKKDFYTMASYVQGLIQVQALKLAIESKDVTRAGYLKALHTLKGWNAGGMIQPVTLEKVPYVTSTSTRILKPDFKNSSWEQVAPYAAPSALAK